jgi:hypothetical protein
MDCRWRRTAGLGDKRGYELALYTLSTLTV